MKLRLADAIVANGALEELISQGNHYPVDVAYRFYKLKKDLLEVESFTMLRLSQIFGQEFGNLQFTSPEQEQTYNMIVSSEIEIDLRGLELKDILTQDGQATLTIQSMEALLRLFPEEQKEV